MVKVYFEGQFGIVSSGELLTGRVGDYRRNVIVCNRTGKTFRDRGCWQTREQYESLRNRDVLLRDRDGSLHREGRLRSQLPPRLRVPA